MADPLNQIPARDWRSLKVRRIGPPKSTPNVQATDQSSFGVKLTGKSTPNPQATDRNAPEAKTTDQKPTVIEVTDVQATCSNEPGELEGPLPTLEAPLPTLGTFLSTLKVS